MRETKKLLAVGCEKIMSLCHQIQRISACVDIRKLNPGLMREPATSKSIASMNNMWLQLGITKKFLWQKIRPAKDYGES